MPRYFFVAQGPGQKVADPHGRVLPDLEIAHETALRTARDLVRNADADWKDWSFRITDQAGHTLLVVPFPAAVAKH
jgi:hypothetical protein